LIRSAESQPVLVNIRQLVADLTIDSTSVPGFTTSIFYQVSLDLGKRRWKDAANLSFSENSARHIALPDIVAKQVWIHFA
ncbi:MAG: hypothetical protein WBA57_01215, partial [Elainellaceae cyanobacterium]